MSSLSFSFIITFTILSIFPFSSTAFLYDLDVDKIRNGKEYHIITLSDRAPLTFTRKTNECPLYITTDYSGDGAKVKISSPIKEPYIYLGGRFNLAFVDQESTISCKDSSLVWESTTQLVEGSKRVYITTGGDPSGLKDPPFWVLPVPGLPQYKLMYCVGIDCRFCSNVGFFGDDGLLDITEYPTRIGFEKAFEDVSTS